MKKLQLICTISTLLFLVACTNNQTNVTDEITSMKIEIENLQSQVEELENQNKQLIADLNNVYNYPDKSVSKNILLNYHKAICKYYDASNTSKCYLAYNRIELTYKGKIPLKIEFLEHLSSGKFGIFYYDDLSNELSAWSLYIIGPNGLDKGSGEGVTIFQGASTIDDEYSIYVMSEGGYNISKAGSDYIVKNFDIEKLIINAAW